jgi:hypothetical protein
MTSKFWKWLTGKSQAKFPLCDRFGSEKLQLGVVLLGLTMRGGKLCMIAMQALS